MTTDEQTAMHMGACGLARLIVRFRRLTEQTSEMSGEESEASVGSELSALAMMTKALEAHRAVGETLIETIENDKETS